MTSPSNSNSNSANNSTNDGIYGQGAKGGLPPEELPLLNDYGRDEPGPYAYSKLKTVTGQRINPHAQDLYDRRELCVKGLRKDISPPVTAAHDMLELFIDDVKGFDPRANIKQPPIEEWLLPRFISRVVPSNNFPQWPIPQGAYAVDWAKFNPGMKIEPSAEWTLDFKSRLPEGSFTILDFIGKHHYVTELWTRGPKFWESKFMDQFDAVIVPEFSSFLNNPRPQYLIGERQKQIFAEEGSEAGKIIIPSLAWSSEASLRRQVDLLGSLYPYVNTVFLDLLAVGVDRVQWVWSRLKMLEKHAAHLPFRFIISGATSGWAIRELTEIFPKNNFHIMHIAPFMEATFMTGTKGDRSQKFREVIRRYERMADGKDLPNRKPEMIIEDSLRDDHE